MVPYFPTHRPVVPPHREPPEDKSQHMRPGRGPFSRDEADALWRMTIMLGGIALFLFLVAMIGR